LSLPSQKYGFGIRDPGPGVKKDPQHCKEEFQVLERTGMLLLLEYSYMIAEKGRYFETLKTIGLDSKRQNKIGLLNKIQ
jgi:hypothetical protein